MEKCHPEPTWCSKRSLFILVFLSFTVKLAVSLYLGTFFHPAVWESETIVQNMLAGKGYLIHLRFGVPYYTAIAPFHATFLYLVYLFFGVQHWIVILLQIGLSCALIYLAYGVCRLISELKGGQKLPLLAAFLVAFHPAIIVYSTTTIHEVIHIAFWVLLVFYLSLKFIKQSEIFWKLVVLFGMVSGLTIHVKSTIIPYLALFGLIFLLTHKTSLRKKIGILAVYGCLIVAMLSPWIIRNYLMFHRWMVTPSYQGECLWWGNNEFSNGTPNLTTGEDLFSKMPPTLKTRLENATTEWEHMKIFQNEVFDFWKNHPKKGMMLIVKKFLYFWGLTPTAGLFYPKSWLTIYKFYYIPLLIFFLLGLLWIYHVDLRMFLCVSSLFLGYSALHAFYFVEMRHRFSVEPLMLCVVPLGVYYLSKMSFRARSHLWRSARNLLGQS